MTLAGTQATVTLSGTFLVTTEPAPIVTSFPIETLPTLIHLDYYAVYLIITGPKLLPIVVNCDKLTLFPIMAVGFTTIDMP